jgi:hypothetical protein
MTCQFQTSIALCDLAQSLQNGSITCEALMNAMVLSTISFLVEWYSTFIYRIPLNFRPREAFLTVGTLQVPGTSEGRVC